MAQNWTRPDPNILAYELSSHSPNKGSKEYPLGGFREIYPSQRVRNSDQEEDPDSPPITAWKLNMALIARFRITI